MKYFLILLMLFLSACMTTKQSVYEQLGGQTTVEKIVDHFITEIEFDPIMYNFFKDSKIERFREKLIEHVCSLTDGPCQYTGDTMEQVHTGMNITESDFNHGVDLFIRAMKKANVPYTVQNRVLARLVPTRANIIYL